MSPSAKVQTVLKKIQTDSLRATTLKLIRSGSFSRLEADFGIDLSKDEWKEVAQALEMWSSDNPGSSVEF